MHFSSLLIACVAVHVAAAQTPTTPFNGVTTPVPFEPGMVTNCESFTLVVSGDTCEIVSEEAGISVADLEAWNPSVGPDCTLLLEGDYVCIGLIGATGTPTAPVSKGPNGISTPLPIQAGMTNECNSFYQVNEGVDCTTVANAAGISVAEFEALNPAVGSACLSLDVGDFVCIGVL